MNEQTFANRVNALGTGTYPAIYAGDELTADGQTDVYVTSGNDSALLSAIQPEATTLGSTFSVVQVPLSYSALNSISDIIRLHLAQLLASGYEVSSWAGDPRTGTVDVSLAGLPSGVSSAQAQAYFSATISPDIVIATTTAGQVSLLYGRYNDVSPFYGSDNIQNGSVECTAGFGAYVGTTSVSLTAGHCGSSSSWYVGTTGTVFGETGQLHFGDGVHDVQTIKDKQYAAAVWGGAYGKPATTLNVLGGFSSYVAVGQLITFDGSIKKEVRDVKVTASGNNVCIVAEGTSICDLIQTNRTNESGVQACGFGDSGGPVYQYAYGNNYDIKAAGLIEGGNSSHCFATELAADLAETGATLATG
ncbi:MAG: chymotrypsin family serine protease [Acidimicrobiales bacterium]